MATVHRCRDYQEMSRIAAARVIAAVAAKSEALLCVPAGNSPAGLYRELIREAEKKPDLFQSLRVVKLDEWLGVLASDPASCEYFLKSRLLEPLAVAAERYISFDPETADPLRECDRIRGELEHHGPIDLCILGLGKNGHVGLNEPGPSLKPLCHVVKLSEVISSSENGSLKWPTRTYCTTGTSRTPKKTSLASGSPVAKSYSIL
jgi:galactosamine-6-phosphate isomerase